MNSFMNHAVVFRNRVNTVLKISQYAIVIKVLMRNSYLGMFSVALGGKLKIFL